VHYVFVHKEVLMIMLLNVKIRRVVVTGIIIVCCLFCTQVYAQLQDSPWPMFAHDPQHTGRSPNLGPQSAYIKWKFCTYEGSGCWTPPVVGSDGTVYIGGEANDSWVGHTVLYAINPDGSLKWMTDTLGNYSPIQSAPAISVGETIYVATYDSLYKIDPLGNTVWHLSMGGEVFLSHPTIGSDGTIYIAAGPPSGDTSSYLFAINPDGSYKWINAFPHSSSCGAPTLGSDGKIYLALVQYYAYEGRLFIFEPNGDLFRVDTLVPEQLQASPALGAGDTIHLLSVPSLGNKLFKIAPGLSGSTVWTYPRGSRNTPAIGSDGTIYYAHSKYNGILTDFWFEAVNPDGSEKWQYYELAEPIDHAYCSAAIGSDGTIYVAHGKMYAFNPDGTIKWSSLEMGHGSSCSPIAMGADTTLYVHSYDTLYCFGYDAAAVVGKVIETPTVYSLRCYPNPVMKGAQISYTIPKASHVKISVYDVTGRCVSVLKDGHVTPGRYEVPLKDIERQGVYCLRMNCGDVTRTEKIIVIK
jgi:outer membrane protein assembly factor BamB